MEGENSKDDTIIIAIYEALKDYYEEATTDYVTDYNSYVNCRRYASFTTYDSPDDIETILAFVENIIN